MIRYRKKLRKKKILFLQEGIEMAEKKFKKKIKKIKWKIKEFKKPIIKKIKKGAIKMAKKEEEKKKDLPKEENPNVIVDAGIITEEK